MATPCSRTGRAALEEGEVIATALPHRGAARTTRRARRIHGNCRSRAPRAMSAAARPSDGTMTVATRRCWTLVGLVAAHSGCATTGYGAGGLAYEAALGGRADATHTVRHGARPASVTWPCRATGLPARQGGCVAVLGRRSAHRRPAGPRRAGSRARSAAQRRGRARPRRGGPGASGGLRRRRRATDVVVAEGAGSARRGRGAPLSGPRVAPPR